MRLFIQSLSGTQTVIPPIDPVLPIIGIAPELATQSLNIIFAGQSNSVAMVDEAEFKSSGIVDLPVLDGDIRNSTWYDWNDLSWKPYQLFMKSGNWQVFDGFGIEYRVTHDLMVGNKITDMKMVKNAKSGTYIGYPPDTEWWNATTDPKGWMVRDMDSITSNAGVNWDAIVFIQGESDVENHAATYEEGLTNLINYMHSSFTFTHFIIVKIYDFTGFYKSGEIETLKEAQENVAVNETNVHIVRPEYDLEPLLDDNVENSRGHYNVKGQNSIGKSVAKYISQFILDEETETEMIFKTTSISSAWTPTKITNSGTVLYWETYGSVVNAEEITNNPIYDLSANKGETYIVAKSKTGFTGLTEIELDNLGLTFVDFRYCLELEKLTVNNNSGLTSINSLENCSSLNYLNIDNNSIDFAYFKMNDLIKTVYLGDNNLTSVDCQGVLKNITDALLIDLNSHGTSNGILDLTNNAETRTTASDSAKASLISRGWAVTE